MCGIAGMIVPHGSVPEEHIIRMRDAMYHRGPDNAGIYFNDTRQVALAHRRLSIIDLSDAANQPMTNEDETIWIVYNGEIYNFPYLKRELEKKGHHFRSNSDTEVLLHAYETWGYECVQYLNGMFAFAIYDVRNNSLMIARDRLGIKPLFYYYGSQFFGFASELKAFEALPGLDLEIDHTAVYDFLTYQYIPSPKTIYRNICKLQPGNYLIYQTHDIKTYCYWDLPYRPVQISRDDAIEEVRAQVERSVQAHLISDVPAGIFLSGGIDSSAVACFAAKASSFIQSFCADFDQADKSEAQYAEQVARHVQTTHHTYPLTEDVFDEILYKRFIAIYDEPFNDSSGIPLYFLSRFAKEKVKMVLSGDGGDEVFAGYGRTYQKWFSMNRYTGLTASIGKYLYPLTQQLSPRLKGQPLFQYAMGNVFQKTANLFGATTGPRKNILFHPDFIRHFGDYDDLWFFRQYWRTDWDAFHGLLYFDIKTSLAERMLVKTDRAGMAASLEIRVPLLDHELVEQVFNYPADVIYPNQTPKYLLRKALNDLLPPEILERKKKGFSIPLNKWMKAHQQTLQAVFSKSRAVERGILNPKIKDLFSFANKYHLKGHLLWSVIVLEYFFKKNE